MLGLSIHRLVVRLVGYRNEGLLPSEHYDNKRIGIVKLLWRIKV